STLRAVDSDQDTTTLGEKFGDSLLPPNMSTPHWEDVSSDTSLGEKLSRESDSSLVGMEKSSPKKKSVVREALIEIQMELKDLKERERLLTEKVAALEDILKKD
ncbi:unnamed protein product, partial [Meganyctiphanes norvegica]